METNKHHLFYSHADYKRQPFNTLRSLVVARNIAVPWHRELHATLDIPPRPSRGLAWNIIDNIDRREPVMSTIDYIGSIVSNEALALHEHLLHQMYYIERGTA